MVGRRDAGVRGHVRATDGAGAVAGPGAVVNDNVRMAAYLVSTRRPHPATNLAEAQALAAFLNATNCDFALTKAALRRRRS